MLDILCLDSFGKRLTYLTQWDLNQTLIIKDFDVTTAPYVHFCNHNSKEALVVASTLEDNNIVVKIPNILLQEGLAITIYLYMNDSESGGKTIATARIPVRPRPKPSDYIYVENTSNTILEMIDERISKALEKVENITATAEIGETVSVEIGENEDGSFEFRFVLPEGVYVGEEEPSNSNVWIDTSVEYEPGASGGGGTAGKSAYEIALDNGFEGTEEEWLESLKGADGEKGEQGEQGDKGEKGDAGADGYSPVRGTDYWNDEDKAEIVEEVLQELNEDASYDNVLTDDTVSYKVNTRISTQTGIETTDGATGIYVTGYIPVKNNDTVYLKNVSMKNVDTKECLVFFWEDISVKHHEHSCTNLTLHEYAIWGEDGNLQQFTIQGDTIKYIRIQCTGINDASIITVNQPIPEDSLKTRVSTLEASTSELNTRVAELENSSSNHEDDSIPDYWVSALEEGANVINKALCQAGLNKSAFLFYSDAHWTSNSKKSPALLKYLYENTGMTKTFYGGDVVDEEPDDNTVEDWEEMAYLWEWRKLLKDLPNHHSVVGNHDDGNGANDGMFSEQYIYGYLFAAEETENMTYGDGLYYYIDNNAEKTRYLCLDTGFKDLNSLSTNQSNFIKSSLQSTPSGWHIVVIAHVWFAGDYDAYYNQGVRPIPIIGLSNTAISVCSILDNYNQRVGEFAECKGKVEFCIGGHVHRDFVGTTSHRFGMDSQTEGGIPIILVETDSSHTRGEYAYSDMSINESSVNGIIADYKANKISVVRVGRGTSFTVDLSSGSTVTYHSVSKNLTGVISSSAITQVVDGGEFVTTLTSERNITSVVVTMGGVDVTESVYDADTGVISIDNVTGNIVITAVATYTNVLDTVGYTSGRRITSQGVVSDTLSGTSAPATTVVTGLIPIESGDSIYLSNIVMPKGGGTGCFMALYDNNQTFISGRAYAIADGDDYLNPVWNTENNLAQLTITASWFTGGYIRLCAELIDEASVITINEPIE